MKFKDFQAPILFSSTFKALNLGEKNSSTFKDFQGCVGNQLRSILYPDLFFNLWLPSSCVALQRQCDVCFAMLLSLLLLSWSSISRE